MMILIGFENLSLLSHESFLVLAKMGPKLIFLAEIEIIS